MSDENEVTRPYVFSLLLAFNIMVGLVLLYGLSFGPVCVLAPRTPVCSTAIRQFYAPLAWLHDHTALRKPLEAYFALWDVH